MPRANLLVNLRMTATPVYAASIHLYSQIRVASSFGSLKYDDVVEIVKVQKQQQVTCACS
jgi:hypothetical protein